MMKATKIKTVIKIMKSKLAILIYNKAIKIITTLTLKFRTSNSKQWIGSLPLLINLQTN